MSSLLLLLSFCSCLLLSFIASALEIAFFSLSSPTLRVLKNSEDKRKQQIAQLLSRPRELFVNLFIINISVNILLQNSVSSYLGEEANPLLSIAISFILVVIFGEIFPKHLALRHNLWIAQRAVYLLKYSKRWLRYPREFILHVTVPLSRLFFHLFPAEQPFTRQEISHALDHSQKMGTLHTEERRLIEGFLNLQEESVKEVMRPREEILAYDTGTDLGELHKLFIEEECSRVPVCTTHIDRVYGVIDAQTYFIYQPQIATPADLLDHLTPPFFVPETTPIRKLLKQFDERGERFALVVDEYGAISGLITREDLVEVVVGEIEDRRDSEELYLQPSPDVLIANAKLELSEFEELFGIHLESRGNMVTLGGWLIEQMGEIPASGSTYSTDELLFQVLSSTPKRVHRLYIRKLFHPSAKEGGR